MILAAHDLGFKDQLDAHDPLDFEERRRKKAAFEVVFFSS
jgi:hypothetical protein